MRIREQLHAKHKDRLNDRHERRHEIERSMRQASEKERDALLQELHAVNIEIRERMNEYVRAKIKSPAEEEAAKML